ncbi:F-box/kelch-repeat protein At1g15670-like [Curcuma longa]|uniref:F-box/kelch-repeat protein At1g15670-like n=1 Tax=Curcuma longa TaxID=136217 RepID=UPI003D9E7B01
MEAELIPGLPEEIAWECLARVPFVNLGAARAVSKLWKRSIESAPFHGLRKSTGVADSVVAVSQAQIPENEPVHPSPSLYRLSFLDPATGAWSCAPPVPGGHRSLPRFCQIVSVGCELVVVGGWNSRTWAASDEVHIYDLARNSWRTGAPMPGPARSFFACAGSPERRMVFVAGGHDESKNALRSALAYDVTSDAWVRLPDMARARDECCGVLARDAFQVLDGYSTEAQAQFMRNAESFDVNAWRWGPVEEEKLDEAVCPRTRVVGGDGRMYMCLKSRGVAALKEGEGWQTVAELPDDMRVALQMVAWQRGLIVLGSGNKSRDQVVYVLDLKTGKKPGKWRRLDLPREFSGHVQAACSFRI